MKLSQFNVVHEHNGSLLIMNARTGGILSLNPEYAQKFKRIQEGDVRDADDLVAELIRGGILVNEERDELGEIRLQSRAARFANTALSLTIAPTMACNFCCPYCYEKGQAYTTMGEEVLTQLSKFVKDYYPGIASLSVGWYGGEPLLGMKMIERITSDLKDVVGPTCEYSASMGTKPIARLMRASWRHGFQGDQDCPRCCVTRTRFALSDIYSLRAGSKWWLARKWPLTCGDAARMLAPDYRHPCIPAKWRKFTPREYEKE